jgi:hypothetical protein
MRPARFRCADRTKSNRSSVVCFGGRVIAPGGHYSNNRVGWARDGLNEALDDDASRPLVFTSGSAEPPLIHQSG